MLDGRRIVKSYGLESVAVERAEGQITRRLKFLKQGDRMTQPQVAGGSETILIAEDEPDLRELACSMVSARRSASPSLWVCRSVVSDTWRNNHRHRWCCRRRTAHLW